MISKKKQPMEEKIEREYIVPLREKCRPVPRYKKTPKAIKSLKEFIARHMKIRDRDLKKIKIDGYLNELIWARGIKKPLHKVKVSVVREGEIVRVYASELSPKLKFKKERTERKEIEAKTNAEKRKSLIEKAKEQMKPGNKKEDTLGEEKKVSIEKVKEEEKKPEKKPEEKEILKKTEKGQEKGSKESSTKKEQREIQKEKS